ncbi:hypothetical protein [Kitasatospora sp. NPDC088783]|uniref:hypothetical protein n=1 Tax=Kitasatospora sp. NPDC088783 TaxID=3364077 RepID=UPI00380ECFA5
MTDTRPTATELDERERRLRADAQDAQKALNNARRRYDAIGDELREIRGLRGETESNQPQRPDLDALLAELNAPGPWHFARADVAALIAYAQHLETHVAELEQQLGAEHHAHTSTITERDRAFDYADRLAAAIAPEEAIGEHTGMNNP